MDRIIVAALLAIVATACAHHYANLLAQQANSTFRQVDCATTTTTEYCPSTTVGGDRITAVLNGHR